MTGNVVNQWEKGRIFNKSCGPIDYIWKKITLNFFFMTYRFTFPSGLKTKKKNQKGHVHPDQQFMIQQYNINN